MIHEAAVKIDPDEWEKGYDAGYERIPLKHAGTGSLSFTSGYIEGRADRDFKKPRRSNKTHLDNNNIK